MEPNRGDSYHRSSMKIRNRERGRKRAQPYRRPRDNTDKEEPQAESTGLLGRLSNYLVPSWISGMFQSGNEIPAPSSDDSSDDESESGEVAGPSSQHQSDDSPGKAVARDLVKISSTIAPRRSSPTPAMDSDLTRQHRTGLLFQHAGDHATPLHSMDRDSSSHSSSPRRSIGSQQQDISFVASSTDDTYQRKLFVESMVHEDMFSRPQAFSPAVERPAFKVSSFVAPRISSQEPSPSSVRSPFYGGRTSFGGASSFRAVPVKRQKLSPVQPVRLQVQPKSIVRKHQSSVTSATAKRILSTLEQLPSPLKDAAKLQSRNSLLTGPYRRSVPLSKTSSILPPAKQLSIPRQAPLSFSTPHPDSIVRRDPVPVTTFKAAPLPAALSSDVGRSRTVSGGKIRRERTKAHISHAIVVDDDEDDSSANPMPDILSAKPLVLTSLPNFKEITTTRPSATLDDQRSSTPKAVFKFASPTVIKLPWDTPSQEEPSLCDFQFRNPQSIDVGPTISGSGSCPVNKGSPLTTTANPFFVVKSIDASSTGRSAKVPSASSHPEPSNFFESANSDWDCRSCMISNPENTPYCTSCGKKRSDVSAIGIDKASSGGFSSGLQFGKKTKATNVGLGSASAAMPPSSAASVFKRLGGTPGWKCSACSLQNTTTSVDCAACGLPQCGKATHSVESAGLTLSTDSASANVFGGFSVASNNTDWECGTCFIKNKDKDVSCVACTAAKPSSVAATKTTTSTLQTGAAKDDSKSVPVLSPSGNAFVAHATPIVPTKEDISTQSKVSSVSSSGLSRGFKFGVIKPGWDCGVCLVRNDATTSGCVACGAATSSAATSSSIILSEAGTLFDGKPARTTAAAPVVVTSMPPGVAAATPTISFKFGESKGGWKCNACSVENNDNKTKCLGCTAPKPGTADVGLPKSSDALSSTLTSSATSSAGFSFGASDGFTFGTTNAGWECEKCKLNNAITVAKCTACGSAKATTASSTTESSTLPGFKFGVPKAGWDCNTCLLRNDETAGQCVACNSSKAGAPLPVTSTSSSSASLVVSSFGAAGGFKFGAPKPGWDCSACLVKNDEAATRCVACSAAKEGAKPTTATTIPSAKFSFGGSKFGEPKPGWDCSTCLLRNDKTASQCVACSAAKPGAALHVTSTSSSAASLTGFSFGTAGGFKFGAQKPGWDCSACLVKNDEAATQCVACSAAKAGAKPSTATTIPSAGFSFGGSKFGEPKPGWDCSTCLLRNDKTASQCVACSAAKPGAVVAVTSTSSSSASLAGFSFGTAGGFKFGAPKPGWDCSSCLLRNDKTASQCVACSAAKPGAALAVTSTRSSSASLTGFSFDTAGGLKFEAPKPVWDCGTCQTKNDQAATQCVACSAAKPGSTTATASTAPSTGFSFGTADGFKFGAVKPGWDCSACLAKNSETSSKCTACGAVKGSQTVSATPAPSLPGSSSSGFSFGKSSGFSFGNSSTAPSQLGMSAFGQPASTATTSAVTNMFGSGIASVPSFSSSTTPFNFTASAPQSTAQQPFTFGGTGAPTLSSGASQLLPNANGNMFTPSATSSFSKASEPLPSFGFGSAVASTPPTFNVQPAASSSFSQLQAGVGTNQGFNFSNSSVPSFDFAGNANKTAQSAGPAFNASATGASSLPPRNIKRAVRRMKR